MALKLLKEELAALQAEEARREQNEKLRFVRLNAACRRYADAWLDPLVRTLVYAAPNGVGKSFSTVALLGWTIWVETAPRWFRDPIRAKWRFPKSFRLVSTVKECEDGGSIQKAIRLLWPKSRYAALRGHKSFDAYYRTDTGWDGDIMTYEQKAEEFEGGEKGLIVFNEPPPEPIYKACTSRTRMGGMLIFPMTPLSSAAWIKDKIVDGGKANTKTIFADIEEACVEHGENGHLKHADIQAMIEDYDPDEIEARAHGRFMHLSGRVWKNFRRDVFVGQPDQLPWLAHCPKFMVVDPGGWNKPFAVIWGQVMPAPIHGIQILMEWPPGDQENCLFERMKETHMTAEAYADTFKRMERTIPGTPRNMRRILDRRYGNVKDIRFGRSIKEYFYELGFEFEDSYGTPLMEAEIETGIKSVNNYLRLDPMTKAPMLIIHPRCVNTIRAVERWGRDPKSQKPNDDVWKNFADVVRYLASAGLQFETHIPESEWNRPRGPVW